MRNPNSIVEITDHSSAEWVAPGQEPVLLAFYNENCSASQKLLAMLANVAMRFRKSATFVKANLAKAPGLAARLRVDSAPTLLLFHGGVVSFQFLGELSPPELDDLLNCATRQKFVSSENLTSTKP